MRLANHSNFRPYSFFLDVSAAVEHLMRNEVQECSSGFICLVCGKTIQMRKNIRRHMKELHVNVQYRCPPCKKMFKTRASIYKHISKEHRDWKGVNYDNFLVT
jgi:uncharacterized C2H2 Zn-finger protein